jgi:hypothetical protein
MRKPPEGLVPDHAPLREVLAQVEDIHLLGSLEKLHDLLGARCDQFLHAVNNGDGEAANLPENG